MKLQGSYAYDKTGNRMASKRLVTTQGSDCTDAPPGGTCTPTGPVAQLTERTYGCAPANHRVITIGNAQRNYDAAGNTIWIGPRSLEFVPPNDPEEPPPDNPLESAAYSGTEQSTIGLDDGNPPPGTATKTFVYNVANRMASVSQDGNLTMSYRYNGKGERVYRSGSGQVAHTVFDPGGRWIGDYDEHGQAIQQAIWRRKSRRQKRACSLFLKRWTSVPLSVACLKLRGEHRRSANVLASLASNAKKPRMCVV